MKRGFIILAIIALVFFLSISNVYASNNSNNNNNTYNSKLVEIKEKEMKSLDDYKESYGSDTYALTAFILHKVQVYSIPLCFLGIIIGAVSKYVVGIRHIEKNEKGLAIMVSFITVAIICQILPLVFAIVVKFGRE